MPDYLAVFKLAGSKESSKATFRADGTLDAIEVMVKQAGVTTSAGIDEFEILEVLYDKKSYSKVASKGSSIKRESKDKPRIKALLAEETFYSPYKVTSA